MTKQKGNVDTWNELINNYRAQKQEDKKNSKDKKKEENKEEKKKFLDTIADSICKDSSKVLTHCEKVKTSVTNMITNKNEEIQNAKDDSNREKKNVDQNIKVFNNLKNEVEVSLNTISQKVKAIDKDIEGNN